MWAVCGGVSTVITVIRVSACVYPLREAMVVPFAVAETWDEDFAAPLISRKSPFCVAATGGWEGCGRL